MQWAAGKATIRGAAKALIRQHERDKSQCIFDLEAKIVDLELKVGTDEPCLIERQLAIDRASLVQIQLEEAKLCWRASN